MGQSEQFDALVLGSGQGGDLLAWHLARSGQRVAVVERRYVGGSCPNIACMPSKNEVWGARIAYLARHAAQFGTITGPVTTDMVKVRQRKRDMVDREIAIYLARFKSSGAELVMGSGQFMGPKVLDVQLNDGGVRRLTGDKVFINVGSHAAMPSVPGLAKAQPLTHIEALDLDYAPSHLIVLGAGYVGLELAQAYRRFGSRVTVIETGQQIMSREDPDIVEAVHRILSEEGIQFVLSAEPVAVQGRSGEGVSLTARTLAGAQTIEGSDILVAIGRIPNTTGIGLDTAGVALGARGYIQVNDRLETTSPDVWAIGECAGSPQFTHASVDDFRIIRDNLAGGARSTGDRLVPYCVFIDPPLAHIGLSERDAQRQGIAVRVGKLPMSAVLRREATDEIQGFMKVLVGTNDDRILGFTMIGADAGEVLAAIQTAMLAGLPYPKLRDAVIAHLTTAEGLGALLGNVPPIDAEAKSALTSSRLFFLDLSAGRILSANPDGSDLKTIINEGRKLPDGLVLDVAAGHIYWTNMGDPKRNDGSIMRSDLNGKNIVTIVPPGGTFTPKQLRLETSSGKLYWSDREGMRMMRANLDGSKIETLVDTSHGDSRPGSDPRNWCVGVAVDTDGGKLYWTQKGGDGAGAGRIFRANIEIPQGQSAENRRDIELLYDNLPEPIDLDLDPVNRTLYWTDRGDPPRGNTVNRAPMDPETDNGKEPEILLTHLMEGIGLALDLKGGRMFITDLGGSVYSANLDGSNRRVLLDAEGNLTGIAYAEVPCGCVLDSH